MSQKVKSYTLLILDIFVLYLALYVALIIHKKGIPSDAFLNKHLYYFTFLFPFWIIGNYVEGLYGLKTIKASGLIIAIIRPIIFSTVISFVFFYLLDHKNLSPKTNIFIISIFSFIGFFLSRKFLIRVFSSEALKIPVMAVGNERTIQLIKEDLEIRPYLGYKIVKSQTSADDINIEGAQLVVVDRNLLREQKNIYKFFTMISGKVDVMDIVDFAELTTGKIPINSIDETWFIQFCGIQNDKTYTFLKNFLDKGIAIFLFLLVGPFFLLLLGVLLIISGRPLFFRQTRTGYLNKPFNLYKLRTMVVDAEKEGAKWATPGDARITPVGNFLRKTRLDELPQLWNIFKGDMSIVGPRPERPEFIDTNLAVNIPYYNQRHLVKPGVTGWAQVNFRYGYSENDSLIKLQYDLYYVKNKNIWMDVATILKTIKTVLSGAGQ